MGTEQSNYSRWPDAGKQTTFSPPLEQRVLMIQISRSEQKRQYRNVETAVRELVSMSDAQLSRVPASEQAIVEMKNCRGLKAGSLKRQIKYVTKLLQQEPLDEIFAFLSQVKGSKLEENRYEHQAEQLRDAIVNEALQSYQDAQQVEQPWPIDWQSEVIDQVIILFPDIDENQLRSSAHQYARSRIKAHYREIFRLIRAAADKQRRAQR